MVEVRGGGGSGGNGDAVLDHPDKDAPERDEDGKWWKSPVTGIVYCKGVPQGETHTFDGDPIEYVSAGNNNTFAANNAARACTSNITAMNSMPWPNKATFNEDISHWDTSNVTNMERMFFSASAFNHDIGAWDTSNVTNMAYMFYGASAFNQDIGAWDTAKVTRMGYMFWNASEFNQDLSAWCVEKIATNPTSFDASTPAWEKADRQPVWGTCPSP